MKKIFVILFTATLLLSMFIFTTTASHNEKAQVNGSNVSPSPVILIPQNQHIYSYLGKDVIAFDGNYHDFAHSEQVFCHIWEEDGYAFFKWQDSAEKCIKTDNGVWIYNLKENGIEIKEGTNYCVLFGNENNTMTYELLFDSETLGYTSYCNGSGKGTTGTFIFPGVNIRVNECLLINWGEKGSICGDADRDDVVSIMDATEIQRCIASIIVMDDYQLVHADTDRDGRLSVMDATQIQRYIAQLVSEF